jgi:hypothetical protein
MAVLAGALILLAGCAGPMESQSASGNLDAADVPGEKSEIGVRLGAGLQAMLADREDIVKPRAQSLPLAARRDAVLRAYIAGKPTAAIRAASETAKVSPVGSSQ